MHPKLVRSVQRLLRRAGYAVKDPRDAAAVALLRMPLLAVLCEEAGLPVAGTRQEVALRLVALMGHPHGAAAGGGSGKPTAPPAGPKPGTGSGDGQGLGAASRPSTLSPEAELPGQASERAPAPHQSADATQVGPLLGCHDQAWMP
jgi:hypothetical protein